MNSTRKKLEAKSRAAGERKIGASATEKKRGKEEMKGRPFVHRAYIYLDR
jgi:hypothetical protein